MRITLLTTVLALLCIARVDGFFYYWNQTTDTPSPSADVYYNPNYAFVASDLLSRGVGKEPAILRPVDFSDFIVLTNCSATICSACGTPDYAPGQVWSPAVITGLYWDSPLQCGSNGITFKLNGGATKVKTLYLPAEKINSTLQLNGGSITYAAAFFANGCQVPVSYISKYPVLNYTAAATYCFIMNSTVEMRAAVGSFSPDQGVVSNLVFANAYNLYSSNTYVITYTVSDSLIYFGGAFTTLATNANAFHDFMSTGTKLFEVYFAQSLNIGVATSFRVYNARFTFDGPININMPSNKLFAVVEKTTVTTTTFNAPWNFQSGAAKLQVSAGYFSESAQLNMGATALVQFSNSQNVQSSYTFKAPIVGGGVRAQASTMIFSTLLNTVVSFDVVAVNAIITGASTGVTLNINAPSTVSIIAPLTNAVINNNGQLISNSDIIASTITVNGFANLASVRDSTITTANGSSTIFGTVTNSILNVPLLATLNFANANLSNIVFHLPLGLDLAGLLGNIVCRGCSSA